MKAKLWGTSFLPLPLRSRQSTLKRQYEHSWHYCYLLFPTNIKTKKKACCELYTAQTQYKTDLYSNPVFYQLSRSTGDPIKSKIRKVYFLPLPFLVLH